ncbi:MAG: gliding motility-associated protein GldE [Flavobacteriales bacterium]|nr:gliding motility-associated protein GldE [Flavobacteriales bacterium]
MDDPLSSEISDLQGARVLFSVLLLMLSGFISGSEVAFFSIKPAHLEDPSKNLPDIAARRLRKLLDNPKLLLATLLTFNTFVNIALVVVSDPLFTGIEVQQGPASRLVLQVGLVSLAILLFGELIPKIFARRNPWPLAVAASFVFWPVVRFGGPLFQPLLWITRLLGPARSLRPGGLSRSELSAAIEITGVAHMPTTESRILKGIIHFGDKEVSSIMTPRVHVIGPDYSMNFPELLQFIKNNGFSRMPVFNSSPDAIMGILFIKDIIPHINEGPNFDWHSLIREPFFVPENMTALRLLREFQNRNLHMALVVDEHGGLSGLVTLEDIIEEVVGEIEDEHDEKSGHGQKIGEGLYIFDGSTMLSDFLKTCELPENFLEEKERSFDSLAGLVMEIAEKIPAVNEEFEWHHVRFKILKADERRIHKIQVRLLKKGSSSPTPVL